MSVTLRLTDHTPRVTAAMRAQVARHVARTAQNVRTRAVLAIQNPPKSGRRYGRHQASAPGEAPATDTGHLAASIQVEQAAPLRAVIAVNAEYGEVLEIGGAHLAARPFLGPAVEAERPDWEAGLRSIL